MNIRPSPIPAWYVMSLLHVIACRSKTDTQGREFIILNGKVQGDIQDDKKSFVFSLSCKGVPEMFFSVDDEDAFCNWISKLQAACASGILFLHFLL